MVILLKFVRYRRNLTIRDLSKLSGVSKTHISRIERGTEIPTLNVICKLASALGVLPEELYICEECRKN